MAGASIASMFESGAFTPFLFAVENLVVRYFQVSSDGKWIVYNRNNIILRRDARTGEEKELDRASLSPAGCMLSRDGSRLAYVMRVDKSTKALKAMQFPDGTPREILQLGDGEFPATGEGPQVDCGRGTEKRAPPA